MSRSGIKSMALLLAVKCLGEPEREKVRATRVMTNALTTSNHVLEQESFTTRAGAGAAVVSSMGRVWSRSATWFETSCSNNPMPSLTASHDNASPNLPFPAPCVDEWSYFQQGGPGAEKKTKFYLSLAENKQNVVLEHSGPASVIVSLDLVL